MCIVYIVFVYLLLQNVWTALHSAAFNNYPEIIKVLIISGADITALNKV